MPQQLTILLAQPASGKTSQSLGVAESTQLTRFGFTVVKATPLLMMVTGRSLMFVADPESVVSQEIQVSVTPSEGMLHGKVPTNTRFPSAMRSCPITLMQIIFPPFRLEQMGQETVLGELETEIMVGPPSWAWREAMRASSRIMASFILNNADCIIKLNIYREIKALDVAFTFLEHSCPQMMPPGHSSQGLLSKRVIISAETQWFIVDKGFECFNFLSCKIGKQVRIGECQDGNTQKMVFQICYFAYFKPYTETPMHLPYEEQSVIYILATKGIFLKSLHQLVSVYGTSKSKVGVLASFPLVVQIHHPTMHLQVVQGHILQNVRIQGLEISACIDIVLKCQSVDLLVAAEAVQDGIRDGSSELLDELYDLEEVRHRALRCPLQHFTNKDDQLVGSGLVEAIPDHVWARQIVLGKHSLEHLLKDVVVRKGSTHLQGSQEEEGGDRSDKDVSPHRDYQSRLYDIIGTDD